jgi:Ca2+/Na+ antiporter
MEELTLVDIILSFIFTWTVGLIPPVLIRFVIMKRPIRKWAAISISAFFWFANLVLFIALGSQSKTHAVLLLIVFISYGILTHRKKTQEEKEQEKHEKQLEQTRKEKAGNDWSNS